MKPIPLNLLTLFGDLEQKVEINDIHPATISTKVVRGRRRFYATERIGSTYRQSYIGLADDPAAGAEAERIRQAAQSAKLRRATVAVLKRARIPAPTLEVGRLLEVMARARLFERGLVLVGTVAYQTYPCVVGAYLSSSAMMTQDADFAIASFAVSNLAACEDIETVLRRADPSFRAVMHIEDRLPRRFISNKTNLEVDFITTSKREHAASVPIRGLNCAAVPLRYVEFLIQDPIDVVALYGAGIPVRVPAPGRFAVHKLIVASRRSKLAKRDKDLSQARELIDVLSERDRFSLAEAFDDARSRGKRWRSAVDTGLARIERNIEAA